MDSVELTKEQIQHIFLVGTHLHSFQGLRSTSIKQIIKNQGMVQYDPLNPAGRYHDHFLFSRIQHYKIGDFEKFCYKNKLVFEFYNPNVSAISVEHFPIFWQLAKKKIFPSYYLHRIDKLNSLKPKLLDEVYDYVVENGKTTGKDLAHLGKAHQEFASWKSTQTSSSALEYLWLMGKLAIVERTDRFTKVYDSVERYIPKKYLVTGSNSLSSLNFQRFIVQIKSYPIINIKTMSSNPRMIHFSKKQLINDITVKEEAFSIATLSNTAKQLIIPINYEELLNKDPFDENMRIIGVLDPLIWDRDLLKNIFDFEYSWEVYKKEKDRKYGYYVLPLLFKGKFIGRIELKLTNEENLRILKIFNLVWEKDTKVNHEVIEAFEALIDRLIVFTSADKIKKDKSIKF